MLCCLTNAYTTIVSEAYPTAHRPLAFVFVWSRIRAHANCLYATRHVLGRHGSSAHHLEEETGNAQPQRSSRDNERGHVCRAGDSALIRACSQGDDRRSQAELTSVETHDGSTRMLGSFERERSAAVRSSFSLLRFALPIVAFLSAPFSFSFFEWTASCNHVSYTSSKHRAGHDNAHVQALYSVSRLLTLLPLFLHSPLLSHKGTPTTFLPTATLKTVTVASSRAAAVATTWRRGGNSRAKRAPAETLCDDVSNPDPSFSQGAADQPIASCRQRALFACLPLDTLVVL